MSPVKPVSRFMNPRTNRPDLVVFVVCFLLGLALYFVLRSLAAPQLVVTLAVVAVMVFYAIAVAGVPKLRVRLDQAGDNAYYLGLLFTLTSMAVALYEFSRAIATDERSGAAAIIGNFGIALATTIAGIFLRILLNQMRVDLADVERATRIELSESAKQVKATLDSVSNQMGRFLDENQQRTSDQLARIVGATAKTLESFVTDVTKATNDLTAATTEAQLDAVKKISGAAAGFETIASEAEKAVAKLREVVPPPLKLASRLQAVADVLEKVASEAGRVRLQMTDAGDSSVTAGKALADVAARLVGTGDVVSQQHEAALKRIDDSATQLREVLDAVSQALEENRGKMTTLDEATGRSVKQAQDSQAAAQQVLNSLVAVTEGLTDFVNRKG